MSIYDTHKPPVGEGGGLYLKIKDGETVKLRIASEPAIFETEGERDGKVTLTTRYGWKVYNQDAKAAQILQQSATFFKSIAALAQDEEWGDPRDYDIKITRQGSSFNDTTYTVMPSANREPLDQEASDAVKAIDLLDKLKASPFSQRVFWLSEFDKMASQEGSGHTEDIEDLKDADDAKRGIDKARETADSIKAGKKPKEDVVVDVDPSEEIDLSDIPF